MLVVLRALVAAAPVVVFSPLVFSAPVLIFSPLLAGLYPEASSDHGKTGSTANC